MNLSTELVFAMYTQTLKVMTKRIILIGVLEIENWDIFQELFDYCFSQVFIYMYNKFIYNVFHNVILNNRR